MKRRTKRKIKKMFNKNYFAIFGIIGFISLFLLSTAYSASMRNYQIEGESRIYVKSDEDLHYNNDCTMTLSYGDVNFWGLNNGSVNFTLTNIGSERNYNWIVKLPKEYINTIQIYYGANLYDIGDNYYLSSLGWNALIEPNASVGFNVYFELAPLYDENGNEMKRPIEDIIEHMEIESCAGEEGGRGVIRDGNIVASLGYFESRIPYELLKYDRNYGDIYNGYQVSITNESDKEAYAAKIYIDYGAGNTFSTNQNNYAIKYMNNNIAVVQIYWPMVAGKTETFNFWIETEDENYEPNILATIMVIE